MRILTSAAACLALAIAAPAGAQDTVPLPIRIDGPARIQLQLTKSESRDDEPERRANFTYEVTLSKADRDTGRRGVTWSLTHVNGEGVTAETSPSPDIRMTVDETLTPLSLDNLAEVIAATRRQLEESGEFAASGGDALRMLATLTPETAASLFTQDAGMIAMGQGTDLFLGEDNSYEIEGQLPWGEVSVLMIGTYRLVEVDQSAGRAWVRWTQEIDPDSLLAAIPAMVEAMIPDEAGDGDTADMEAKLRSSLSSARLQNSRRCDFTIDIATGLAEKVDCVSLIEFEAGEERSRRETRLVATQTVLS